MSISIELDVDKYKNESSIRAFFANTNSPFFKQNYTLSYDQMKCFKQTISIKVIEIWISNFFNFIKSFKIIYRKT